MKLFTELIEDISYAHDESIRIHLLKKYFNSEDSAENKNAALNVLTGRLPKKRVVHTKLLREWTSELTGYPIWLLERSENETDSFIKAFGLLLENSHRWSSDTSLENWISRINQLAGSPKTEIKNFIARNVIALSPDQRILMLKLMTGTSRTTVSRNVLVKSIAETIQVAPEAVSLRMYSNYSKKLTLSDLRTPIEDEKVKMPEVFPEFEILDKPLESLNPTECWEAFGNQDGVEIQLVKHGKSVLLWAKDAEIITDKFPEITTAASSFDVNMVLYGKIIPKNPEMSVEPLLARLAKKTITKKDLQLVEPIFIVMEILKFNERHYSSEQFLKRHLNNSYSLKLPKKIPFSSWDDLLEIHQRCRDLGFTGLYLKRKQPSRQYYFWKATSHIIKAVLMYVELDGMGQSGLRSLTFGLFRGEEILPVAKISQMKHLIDTEEILEFVKSNTAERFGPVRTVLPALVYELRFDSVKANKRRKCGLSLTNPTLYRKIGNSPELTDTIEKLKSLV